MKTIELNIWKQRVLQNGQVQSKTRKLTFQGQLLAEHDLTYNSASTLKQTLYETEQGLAVYIEYCTAYVGDWSYAKLVLLDDPEKQLGPLGEYQELGTKTKYDRPMTLDEYLNQTDLI